MGLFDFLRRKDEKAIPEPGSPEFDAAVSGSALPDSKSVEMRGSGWASVDDAPEPNAAGDGAQTLDLRGVIGLRKEVLEALRRRGIDPESGQQRQIDAGSMPGLQEELMGILRRKGVQIPGMTAGLLGAEASVEDRLEQLDQLREAGAISDAEYGEHRTRILGEG
jgi:hypothetical protein